MVEKNNKRYPDSFKKLDDLILRSRTRGKTTLRDLRDFFIIILEIIDYVFSRYRYGKIIIGLTLPIFGSILAKAIGGPYEKPNIPLFIVGLVGLCLSTYFLLRLKNVNLPQNKK